ncbi:MAG: peptidase M75 [Proteobacteria bacterium]|nr:MAG: peptidase M75 [Pseudomonadota bacterium]
MNLVSMKKFMSSAALLTMISCGGSSGGGGGDDGSTLALQVQQKAILAQFANFVIVPTYSELAEKSAALKAATDTFAGAQTQANLDAARAAWIATRIPWERSEAFLFGPVDSNGYDPAMDDWPLDHTKLDATVAAGSTDVATAETDVKGFHAIEFLLWGYNKSKTLASITTAEDNYLKLLTADHVRVTALLRDSWKEGSPSYATVFTTAGESGNDIYTSPQAAVQEMLEAMIGIADEVANGKISGPYKDQDSNKVESQFSYNSLVDFQDNLYSLRNVYFGSRDGTAATASLSTFVKAKDAALDVQVRAEIEAAIASIGLIPEPFRDSLKDPAAAPTIDAAIAAINTLGETLNTKVRAIVLP